MQASLLSHALDCSGATRGELCVGGETADGQVSDAPIMDVVVKGRPVVTKGFIKGIRHHLSWVSAPCLSKHCLSDQRGQ